MTDVLPLQAWVCSAWSNGGGKVRGAEVLSFPVSDVTSTDDWVEAAAVLLVEVDWFAALISWLSQSIRLDRKSSHSNRTIAWTEPSRNFRQLIENFDFWLANSSCKAVRVRSVLLAVEVVPVCLRNLVLMLAVSSASASVQLKDANC